MNVEIGNPAYKIYEGDPDDDAGELLDSDFALDPDKVNLKGHLYKQYSHPHHRNISSPVQNHADSTWEE